MCSNVYALATRVNIISASYKQSWEHVMRHSLVRDSIDWYMDGEEGRKRVKWKFVTWIMFQDIVILTDSVDTGKVIRYFKTLEYFCQTHKLSEKPADIWLLCLLFVNSSIKCKIFWPKCHRFIWFLWQMERQYHPLRSSSLTQWIKSYFIQIFVTKAASKNNINGVAPTNTDNFAP